MSFESVISSQLPRLVFFLVLVGGLGYLLHRDRENVKRVSILFYRRTKHGIDYIDRVANAAPRFWSIYGWTGVLMGLMTIPFILWNVFISFSSMLNTGGASAGPSLIAPGLTSQTTFQSGVSFVPVEYWVIAIGILMFVHEMSHGIIARAEGMEINSVGWIVLGIIPGAFVEPKGEDMLPEPGEEGEESKQDDEKDISGGMWGQGSLGSQLKVLAAGSFANYLTAIIFAALSLLMFVNVAHPAGVQYIAAENGSAIKAGMDNGTIYSMGEERVRYFTELESIIKQKEPGEVVYLNTSEGEFNVSLGQRNGSAHLGIYGFRSRGVMPAFFDMIRSERVIKPGFKNYSGIISWTLSGLQIIALLNLLIGMFNMLPVKPLDGGQMVSAIMDEYMPNQESLLNPWSLLIWAGLLTAILYSVFAPMI